MKKKTLFEPGDLVKSFTGQNGLVISTKTLDKIRDKVIQGRRPGHFFAAGCPDSIDYLLKVPVFFEDRTYDIMKPMNIKRTNEDIEEKRSKLEEMLQNIILLRGSLSSLASFSKSGGTSGSSKPLARQIFHKFSCLKEFFMFYRLISRRKTFSWKYGF